MSPQLQKQFLQQIVPIITGTVPYRVQPLSGEDPQELVQDCLADACAAADSLERRRQPVIPRSVAYYAIQRLKSGRRSTGSGRTDVMSPGCRLDGRSTLSSIDAPVNPGTDGDCGDLHDALADNREDPAAAAGRRLDWSAFCAGLSEQQRRVLTDTAQGYRGCDTAVTLRVSRPRITQIKAEIAAKARAFWGPDVLLTAAAVPQWRRDLRLHQT